jgi:hypothetical protein
MENPVKNVANKIDADVMGDDEVMEIFPDQPPLQAQEEGGGGGNEGEEPMEVVTSKVDSFLFKK